MQARVGKRTYLNYRPPIFLLLLTNHGNFAKIAGCVVFSRWAPVVDWILIRYTITSNECSFPRTGSRRVLHKLKSVFQDGARDDERMRIAQGADVPLGTAALRRDQGLHLRTDPLLLLQLRVHPGLLSAGVMPGEMPAVSGGPLPDAARSRLLYSNRIIKK